MTIVNIDIAKLDVLMRESDDLDDLVKDKAQLINKTAAGVFETEEVKGNEFRTSETSPPKYLASFKTKRNGALSGKGHWIAYNDDPGAVWVEVGARAGGTTPVLKYRPFGRSLDLLRVR